MAYTVEDLLERQHRRWMKPNAHLYMRSDASRFMRPDAERFHSPNLARRNPYIAAQNAQHTLGRAGMAVPEMRLPEHRGQTVSHGTEPSLREILKLKSDLAALRVHLAVLRNENAIRKARGLPPLTDSDEGWQIFLKGLGRYQDACRKAGFDPDQPRVPAGSPDAGQWTSGGRTAERETGANRGRLAARSPSVEAACLLQYRQDTFICNTVGLRSCWQQAALRYANCLAGLPIPPLVF